MVVGKGMGKGLGKDWEWGRVRAGCIRYPGTHLVCDTRIMYLHKFLIFFLVPGLRSGVFVSSQIPVKPT